MQKIFLSTIITLFIIFAVSCSSSKHSTSKRLPGLWQVQPINIDGSNKDWPSPYPEYDDKAMLGYAVSNDKDNLYITVETGDPATQLKILREGLTVWIDKTANKEASKNEYSPLTPRKTKGNPRFLMDPLTIWRCKNLDEVIEVPQDYGTSLGYLPGSQVLANMEINAM